jgi:hypothetical protein
LLLCIRHLKVLYLDFCFLRLGHADPKKFSRRRAYTCNWIGVDMNPPGEMSTVHLAAFRDCSADKFWRKISLNYSTKWEPLCVLVVRVTGDTTEMYSVCCEVRTEFIYVM